MKAKLDTYAVAYVDAMRNRLSALEPENKGLRDRLAALEARCKRLEEAGDAVMDAAYNAQGWDGTRLGNALEAWQQAKEAKP